MRSARIVYLAILLVSLTATGVAGQGAMAQGGDACTALVETALEALADNCNVPRNTACYGHTLVDAQFWQGQDVGPFAQPADTVPVTALQTIHTAAIDPERGVWGLVLMRLQANLPDTLPGQAVTFLLMGDATLENAASPTSGSPGEFGPMQAVYFATGLEGPACHQAPHALVVQGPAGVPVSLSINDMTVIFSSTVVFSLPEPQTMVVALLEGHLQLTLGDTSVSLNQPDLSDPLALPVIAVTLNAEGRVDGGSQFVAPPELAMLPAINGASVRLAGCSVTLHWFYIGQLGERPKTHSCRSRLTWLRMGALPYASLTWERAKPDVNRWMPFGRAIR